MVAMYRQKSSQAEVQPSGAAGIWAPVSENLGAGDIQNIGTRSEGRSRVSDRTRVQE